MTIALHVDQERAEGMLGASEAAAVLGVDRYKSPISVWRRHRGLTVPGDGEESEPAYWGTVLEGIIRGHYAIKSKRVVLVPRLSTTLDGWLRCTPDGISAPATSIAEPQTLQMRGAYTPGDALPILHEVGAPVDDDSDVGGLQVKTCDARLRDEWRDGAPAAYEVQCRVEMAVTGLPWTDIVCLCGGNAYIGPWRIYRDLAIEARILETLREFWDMVKTGREPSVDHTEAWRLHVSEKLGRAEPVIVEADNEMRATLERWRDARTDRLRAERIEEQTKNEILLRMSNAGATRIDAGEIGRVTAYRTSGGTWALKAPAMWKDDK